MKLRTTVAGALLGITALVAPLAPAAASPAQASPAKASPAKASPASQVKAAIAANQGYVHPPAAAKAGYALLKDTKGIACIAMKGMGAMGIHYADASRVDGRLQVRHPEALVYRFTTNGHLRLAALEYVVPRSLWRQNHPTGRPSLFGHRFNFTPAGNRFGLPAYFSLHAWFWYRNPAGRYAPWNPRVHCPSSV